MKKLRILTAYSMTLICAGLFYSGMANSEADDSNEEISGFIGGLNRSTQHKH